ncbi:hypothetical protein [Dyella amyloliquefaciens]|uniref:hypothetical protein n=1 Tax=Dyella amyloliquefaciens TaxID=1770545 RepID=UPI00102E615F|nr:hypothetical protein [Dyella amyloliquefaciens]
MRALSLATVFLAALLANGALADDLRHQVEASMLVEGKAVLNPDGSIISYSLREPDKLPPPVIDLIKQNIATWKLMFVHEPAAPVEEDMTMRIVATDVDGRHTTLRLASAHFEDANRPANEVMHWKDRVRPSYPRRSYEGRVSGTVYVLARVGRDGHVLDADAEQVNLHQYVTRGEEAIYRRDLAAASIRAIKRSTFEVPSAGLEAGQPYWYSRVPVKFHLHDFNNPAFDSHTGNDYGTWEIYVRGPREDIPWLQDRALLAEAPDSTADSGVHQLGIGPTLQKPLAPN